jgi:hypothetical protein
MYFGGNTETATGFVRYTGLIPNMSGKSRFDRGTHKIGELQAELFFRTGETVQSLNMSHISYRRFSGSRLS